MLSRNAFTVDVAASPCQYQTSHWFAAVVFPGWMPPEYETAPVKDTMPAVVPGEQVVRVNVAPSVTLENPMLVAEPPRRMSCEHPAFQLTVMLVDVAKMTCGQRMEFPEPTETEANGVVDETPTFPPHMNPFDGAWNAPP